MYQSPFRLAGITAPIIDKKDLQLARKKLLAELELAGGTTIRINGQEVSRQEIITLFESFNDEATLGFHTTIFSDSALLHFLENGELTTDTWQAYQLNGRSEFSLFISEYFAESVNKLLQNILDGKAPIKDFEALFTRPQFLTARHTEAAFLTALKFYYRRKAVVQDMAIRMENSSGAHYEQVFDPVSMSDKAMYVPNESVTPGEIDDWKKETNIPLLNLLPDELFSELRYDIANALNNLCLIADTQNHSTETAYRALLAAAAIDSNESLQEIIRGNLIIFREKLNPTFGTAKRSEREKPGFKWSGIGVFLFIVFRLIVGSKACNSSDFSNITSTSPSAVTFINEQ